MAIISHHKVVASLPEPLEPGSVYYVRTGAGFDIYTTNDKGIIDSYLLNADRKIDEHVGAGGEAHAMATSLAAGFMSPGQVQALGSQVQYFNVAGAIPREQLKVFFGEATTNAAGDFGINWLAAGFGSVPMHIAVEAQSPAGVKAWAIVDRATATGAGCSGSVVSGVNMQMTVGGPKQTIKPAPSVKVTVMAWGL